MRAPCMPNSELNVQAGCGSSVSPSEGWSCEVQMCWCVKNAQGPMPGIPSPKFPGGTLSLCFPGLMGFSSSTSLLYFIWDYQILKDRVMFYSMLVALNRVFHKQVLSVCGSA